MRTRNIKRKRKTARRNHTPRPFFARVIIVSLALAVVLFAGGYLMQVSRAASKGYAIRELQNEVENLKTEKERLEFQVAKEKSMLAVEEKVSAIGMVPASDVEYMILSEPVVARR